MMDKEIEAEETNEKKPYEKPKYEKKSSLYRDTGQTVYYYYQTYFL